MKFSKQFISATKEMCGLYHFVAAPYLRRSFALAQLPKKAELTICGLGFYELYINGEQVTKGLLSPYISNPDDLLYYDSYDLAPYLQVGENVIGLQLGNGMQNAFGGYVWDFEKAAWRSAPKVALCMEITGVDGTEAEFEADESFRCAPSPIYYDDLRMGERYDARAEIPGWNLPGFDDSGWERAFFSEAPRGEARLCEARPIKAWKELKPIAVWQEDDAYIYDFGENAAGLCRLDINGEAGQTVQMVFGEYIKDGKFYFDNIRFVRPEYENMPLYIQMDQYTCKGGGKETYLPRFTYHGFRYVKVMGITEAQAKPELLTYVVMNTELHERGSFRCSDEVLNQLQSRTRGATLANFYHFPTDCPHREKNGWTADAALSAEHALLNLDPDVNYAEWMRNIRKAMGDNGSVPGIVPTGGWGTLWGNGPAWDCVLVVLPYFLYQLRGDLGVARESAAAFLRYAHYLTTRRDEKGLIAFGLGDWCAPSDPPHSPLVFTDSVTAMDICRKMAVLFDAMDMQPQKEFCENIAASLREAVRTHLLDRETMTFIGGCQTSQAMGIYYDVLDEEEKPQAFQVLLEKIEEHREHIDCGVLGARVLFHVLSDFGEVDLAYRVMTQPDAPSYGNWVARGETALAEDFYTEKQGVNSRNHHFFGDISAWFIKALCGIRLNPAFKGVDTFAIQPHFPQALSFAEGYHEGPLGKIEVRWEKTEDGRHIRFDLKAPQEMQGDFILSDGWVFEDGSSSCPAGSGCYLLRRAG